MAHHKRKGTRHWQKLCSCKYYKQAGNGKNRRKPREAALRKEAA